MWERFAYNRTGKKARAMLAGNSVNLSIPSGSTHRHAIEQIAEEASIPIESLPEDPSILGTVLIRGRTYSGSVGERIDEIVCNYPRIWWWIGSTGLRIERIEEGLGLSEFDEIAGQMTEESWAKGHLAKEALLEIVKKLDEKRFRLPDHLEPSHWRKIRLHNQQSSRKPKAQIRSFEQAFGNRRFVRGVRRRLYRARDRYRRAVALREASSS